MKRPASSAKDTSSIAQTKFQQGLALHQQGQLTQAQALYKEVLKLQPKHVDALYGLGMLAYQMGKWLEAVTWMDKAIALNLPGAFVHHKRGLALSALKKYSAALQSYDRAIALSDTADPALYTNRGNALINLGQAQLALESFTKAIEANPEFARARLYRSLCHLYTGNFELGWQEYEWRWKKKPQQAFARQFSQPLWLGVESLQGKTILLHSEQGLGDTLQFCRYAKLVSSLGARVILEAQPALVHLLQSLEGVDVLLASGQTLPEFDYHCPLMSLPLAFKTTLQSIPAGKAYLKAPTEKTFYWAKKLGSREKPRVGLVWNGGFRPGDLEASAIDKRRNIDLSLIAKLNMLEIDFFSLQKGNPAESEVLTKQAELWPAKNFFNYANELRDFSDTAGLIANLDLVISVDTSVAHLAGAMGKPVWILNRFDSCWRWLLDRTDSPWYPTAKLYRQEKMGEWKSVVQRVAADLTRCVAK